MSPGRGSGSRSQANPMRRASSSEGILADTPVEMVPEDRRAWHAGRARWGDAVAPGFVRLSVGCEPVEELWAAIEAALSGSDQ